MPSRHILLACRPAQLRRFWHVDGYRRHFGMSKGKFWHVHGRSYVVFWPVDGHTSLWHVDGRILACRRAHLLFYTLPFFLSSLLFGIAGRHFDMSTGAFCMSTGAFTILHFTIFPSSLLFGIAGRHFGMSTGAFCMSTGTFTILRFAIFTFQPTFWHRGP